MGLLDPPGLSRAVADSRYIRTVNGTPVGPDGNVVVSGDGVTDTTLASMIATGSTKSTLDNMYAPASISDAIDAKLDQPAVDARVNALALTPLNAPGDGVTPALAVFQAAVNAANGRPLFVPPGNYVFNGSLTGKVNLHFAAGARILQTVNAPAIECTGSGSGASRALQATANAGQNVIQVSTSGLTVGSWILLRSSEVFPGSVAGSKIGELHRIRQIDGSGQLRTISNLDHTYDATCAIVPFGMLEGVRVTGSAEFVNTIGAAMKVPMVRFTACADLVVDVAVTGAGGPAVTISGDTMFDVRARVRDSINDEPNGNFGYGVEVFGAACHGRVYVDMIGGRHAFTTTSGSTTASVPRHIEVSGIAEGTTNTAWDSHEEGEFITFRGVYAFGCRNAAIKHRAPKSAIIDPVVRNCLGIAVRFAPTAIGSTLQGGDLSDIRYLSDGSPGIGVQIEANDVTVGGDIRINCDDQGILVKDGANRSRIKSAEITAGKRGNAATSIGIEFSGTSTNHRVDRGVSIESAATGVLAASTVADVRVAPLRYEAVTTRTSGAIHLPSNPPALRAQAVPVNTVRSALTLTSGRAYMMPIVIADDKPWTSIIPSFVVTTAGTATDTVEVAIYDTDRNLIGTTGPQTVGMDTVGVKTLPAISATPMLGRRYVITFQVISSGTPAVYAGGFATASAAAILGTSIDKFEAGYVNTGSPLPASISNPTVGAIASFPWVQLSAG